MKTNYRTMPSQEELLEIFSYDPLTGCLTKKKTGNKMLAETKGYCVAGHMNKPYYVHRIIWKMHYGYDPINIDHINRNTKDNRICNLREVNQSQNSFNSCNRINNTSGYKGITYCNVRKKWRARVKVRGKEFSSRHSTLDEAISAVTQLREKYHGEYASHS